MSVEVRVPTLPESVADATLVSWHKKPGEPVVRDENLIDLETDKVVLEIPAPTDGVMGEILRQDGETVTTGDLIATIEEGAAAQAADAEDEDKAEAKAEAAPQAEPSPADSAAAPAAAADQVDLDSLSPAVRRLVTEHKLDAGAIEGSGRDGRITKADVLAYMENPQPQPAAASTEAPAKPAPTPTSADSGGRTEKRVPMTRLRARIAQRLLEAQQTAAMLTTFNEVNMQPIMALRAKYKDKFEKDHDARLGFMAFFIKAAIEALKRFPSVNGSIDGKDIIYHGYYDIGIAVSSPRGLVVPILRDADQLSFADIEKAIADFGKRAREGSLTIDELSGGTFSITNGGVFGSMMSTPILNPPQSAILGMHKTTDRAVVENGQVVVRPMMFLALTYDHRIIDGKEAVTSLVTIKECLEDPARLLLQV